MRSLSVVLTIALAPALAGSAAQQTTPQANAGSQYAALKAEMAWLQQVDLGRYQQAYASAAKKMQDASAESDFAKSIQAARDPLGPMKIRVLQQSKVTNQLPGAPDGEYFVTQFNTRFANKAAGVETIIASRQPDGAWRVTGYFIR